MAQVTLTQEWTDAKGIVHAAGSVVTVDDTLAAQLAAQGVCDWLGPTKSGPQTDGWLGPT
ncbi:hypothetical protein R8Z50_06370 [Longispora sp. K20-0274]|uniref:hypothetical protein n=1 Tax=Longispora sp. K20-0274 TaxID=3088255 RepID=UPI00399A33C7